MKCWVINEIKKKRKRIKNKELEGVLLIIFWYVLNLQVTL